LGTITTTAVQFDFEAVKALYGRQRTVYVESKKARTVYVEKKPFRTVFVERQVTAAERRASVARAA